MEDSGEKLAAHEEPGACGSKGLAQMNERLGHIETRLTAIEARLSGVESRMLYVGGALAILISVYKFL